MLPIVLPLAGDPDRQATMAGPAKEAPELRELRRQGNLSFRAGDDLKAIQIYERGYELSTGRGDMRSALRFLNNLGSADYQLLRYRDAIKAYLKARELAVSQRDQETLAAIYFNLSSLYDQLAEIDAATESAERGLELPASVTAKFRSRLLIQSALIQTRQSNWDRAIRELRQAIDLARAQRDTAVEAQAWDELGNALMDRGQLSDAEAALSESLRLRSLNHDERLNFSYESLGELRMRQHEPALALGYFDKAVQEAASANPLAVWRPLYGRGRANLAGSRALAAYADFGESIKSLKNWKAEVPPADAFRISSEVEQHEVYSAYIELAARLYRESGEERYAVESFAAAEDSRAASLRSLWLESGLTKELPPTYWQALSALHEAESAELGGPSREDTIRSLRLKVIEMEAGAALALPAALKDPDVSAAQLLARTRGALASDELLLGFHAGDSVSCLWAVTREAFEFRTLPPQADLKRDIDAFVKAVTGNSDQATPMGRQLYERLFGNISQTLRRKTTWILVPDGPLFDLPFAALVETSGPTLQPYLIERHAIRMVPGIFALFRSPAPEPDALLVAVGDPIYNRADPRLPRAKRPAALPSSHATPSGVLELPRLPGSAREVEGCAAIWRSHGAEALVLEGANANERDLSRALQRNPSVLHLAAHMLFPSDRTAAGMLALALLPDHRVEVLSTTEIASMRANLGLVVLDGCSSGQGPVLPGAGLMGMTRAWLVAGARAVIATRWPAADQDAGELFSSLYRLYLSQTSPRTASFGKLLREAQLGEIRAGGMHAAPDHWATYFCVETN